MTLLGLLLLLLIAAICGAIGQAIVGYSHGGCLVSTAVGLIGALLGFWLARLLDLPFLFVLNIGGEQFPVIWAIIGSTLFVAIISFLAGGRRRGRRW
jgi:uncharacterized membrane protein YeaQ/YmgE (transglycosylase-associated protein family)